MTDSVNTVEPGAVYNIYCDGRSAKNYPPSDREGPDTRINFDHGSASFYEEWIYELFEEGLRLRNVGTQFWACARNGEVVGSPEFDPKSCKWYIERAGGNVLKIKLPNEDCVWTVKESDSDHGYPRTLFLEPANGSSSQLFTFMRAVGRGSK